MVEGLQYLSTRIENSMSTCFLANFTIEMIGNEAGSVLKRVDLSRKSVTRHLSSGIERRDTVELQWLEPLWDHEN